MRLLYQCRKKGSIERFLWVFLLIQRGCKLQGTTLKKEEIQIWDDSKTSLLYNGRTRKLVDVGTLSHSWQWLRHSRWCRNSSMKDQLANFTIHLNKFYSRQMGVPLGITQKRLLLHREWSSFCSIRLIDSLIPWQIPILFASHQAVNLLNCGTACFIIRQMTSNKKHHPHCILKVSIAGAPSNEPNKSRVNDMTDTNLSNWPDSKKREVWYGFVESDHLLS